MTHRRCAFTLVELLIVLLILGILAMLLVPSFVGANQPARESVLRENLRVMRTQVELFTGQHKGLAPGYPGGDRSATPTSAAFMAQMSLYSNEDATTTSATYSAATPIRPYMSSLPPNPFNSLETVRVLDDGEAIPAADGETFGWFYKPATRQLVANTPGSDETGRPFTDY